jgi:hypothetical protein
LNHFPRKREVTNEELSDTLVAGVFWLHGSGLFVTILLGEPELCLLMRKKPVQTGAGNREDDTNR